MRVTHDQFKDLTAAYALGALDAEECLAYDAHLAICAECRAEVRSYSPAIEALCRARPSPEIAGIPFGILPGAHVRPGDHIACFWDSEQEFTRAVGFLPPGLAGRDHCVVFGHEEANDRVLATLRQQVDVERHGRDGRLTVLGCQSTGDATLQAIGATFRAALDAGAPLIRLLGNIGWGRPGWPAEDDLIQFERRVTGAVKDLPAVVVCMYDVPALPGRVVMHAGLAAHPLTVVGNAMHVNTHYLTGS